MKNQCINQYDTKASVILNAKGYWILNRQDIQNSFELQYFNMQYINQTLDCIFTDDNYKIYGDDVNITVEEFLTRNLPNINQELIRIIVKKYS